FPEGMGVPIALAVPEAFFVATGILEVIRDVGGLLIFDVVQGGEVREARVALRGGGEVEAALGEEELAFWHPDVLEALRGGGSHLEGARVCEADVLGGKYEHPAEDEAWVLAGVDHTGVPVDGGFGIGP